MANIFNLFRYISATCMVNMAKDVFCLYFYCFLLEIADKDCWRRLLKHLFNTPLQSNRSVMRLLLRHRYYYCTIGWGKDIEGILQG